MSEFEAPLGLLMNKIKSFFSYSQIRYVLLDAKVVHIELIISDFKCGKIRETLDPIENLTRGFPETLPKISNIDFELL